jgi:hypothetical protein
VKLFPLIRVCYLLKQFYFYTAPVYLIATDLTALRKLCPGCNRDCHHCK